MIDPIRLVHQSSAIKTGAESYACPGCGRRTRNARGRCRYCVELNIAGTNLRKFTLGQLVGFKAAIHAEMERRANELKRAMEGA